jgi:RNA polymerase sigma factor (sigma-70 family)
MANAQATTLLKADGKPSGSDRDLLDRFLKHRDQAAFAGLVQRHGGTVWGVCRRMLPQDQDAEDAFQAVFFVLARKAASIRKAEAVGSWLYGVAFRIARKARLSTTRRHDREQQAAGARAEPPAWGEAACRELQRLLDEEVQRLPDKYKAPFVLCCLEGLSKAEAAQELGWKEGTVSGRLALARKALQQRLARRGVTLSAVLTAGALTQGMASAAPVLAQAGTLTPSAVSLAEGLLHAMTVAKIKAGVSLVLAALLVAGAGLATFPPGQAVPPPAADATLAPEPVAIVLEPETFLPRPQQLVPTQDEVAGTPVRILACSPDGKVMAVADDNTFRLRDAKTGDVLLARAAHTDAITCLAFAPDGRTLASGSADHTIKLWDVETGKERLTLEGHASGVSSLAFTPDSRKLASAGEVGVLLWWDPATGQRLESLKGDEGNVRVLAVSRDGHRLAGGGADGTVSVWDLDDQALLHTLKGHEGAVRALAFSPVGILASAGADGKVKVWDLDRGQEHRSRHKHEGEVWSLAFTPAGRTLVSGGQDGALIVWDPATGQDRQTLRRHTGGITALAMHPSGSHLLSASSDATVQRWPGALWVPPALSLPGNPGGAWFATVSPTGDRMASGGNGGAVTLWTRSLAPAQHPAASRAGVYWDAAYSPDGRVLALAQDTDVQLCDAFTGLVRHTLPMGQVLRSVAFSPDGQYLAAATGNWSKADIPSETGLFHVATGREVARLRGHEGMTFVVRFSPDSKTVATSAKDRTIRLWAVPSGQLVGTLSGPERPAKGMVFLPDGTLVTASWDGHIRFWDTRACRPTNAWSVGMQMASLASSPDGRWLASVESASDGKGPAPVVVWEVATGKVKHRLQGNSSRILGLAFTPDGRGLLAAGGTLSAYGEVDFWDLSTGTLLGSRKTPSQWMENVAISPDGRHVATPAVTGVSLWDLNYVQQERTWQAHGYGTSCGLWVANGTVLATGSWDHSIKLWKAETGQLLATLKGHTGSIRGLALHPDGQTLFSASEDRTAKSWDLTTFTEKATFRKHEQAVYSLALSPDGKTLATGSGDHRKPGPNVVILWDLGKGQPRQTMEGAGWTVWSLAFSPDSELLAGSGNGPTRIWESDTGQLRTTLPFMARPLVFSPDGKFLVTSHGRPAAGYVHLWETATWQERAVLPAQGGGDMFGTTIAADGRSIASASKDGTLRLWSLPETVTPAPVPIVPIGPVTIGKPEAKDVRGTLSEPGTAVAAPADTGLDGAPADGRPRRWLAALVGTALLLALAVGATLYVLKRRRAPKTPARAEKKSPPLPVEAKAALVAVACSGCGKRLKVKAALAGKKVKCPHCGQAVPVPATA